MRNWNTEWGGHKPRDITNVCIVPMRNWNTEWGGHKPRDITSLYRTYEELKLEQCTIVSSVMVKVCIVPMRNWNPFQSFNQHFNTFRLYRTYEELKLMTIIPFRYSEAYKFVSYLWGIETLQTLQMLVSPRHGFVSYLWGIETTQFSRRRRSLQRRFVSYLWGIETPSKMLSFWPTLYRLYRTYEELKQPLPVMDCRNIAEFVSYLWGIETWSLACVTSFQACRFVSYLWGIETAPRSPSASERPTGLYRTYEELKPEREYRLIRPNPIVCIVPMRNWNISFLIRSSFVSSAVCIVPMRNWNRKYKRRLFPSGWRFVSYLWGIETPPADGWVVQGAKVCIVPMRNWNACQITFNVMDIVWVCIVPMRNWNKNTSSTPHGGRGVCIVPMRNWNKGMSTRCRWSWRVCIVPMRNWNERNLFQYSEFMYVVCIVPMRNWNTFGSPAPVHWTEVCIVPMRNWNWGDLARW